MVWFYLLNPKSLAGMSRFLSIPLWSDFIIINAILKKYNIENFQSHYGLILSHRIQLHKWWPSRFQSHYGLILSRCMRGLIWRGDFTFNPTMVWFYLRENFSRADVPGVLSIPLWSDFISQINVLLNAPFGVFQSHYGLILSPHPWVWK